MDVVVGATWESLNTARKTSRQSVSSVRYCKPLFIQAGTFIKDLKLPQSSASRSNEQMVRGDGEDAMIEEEFTFIYW